MSPIDFIPKLKEHRRRASSQGKEDKMAQPKPDAESEKDRQSSASPKEDSQSSANTSIEEHHPAAAPLSIQPHVVPPQNPYQAPANQPYFPAVRFNYPGMLEAQLLERLDAMSMRGQHTAAWQSLALGGRYRLRDIGNYFEWRTSMSTVLALNWDLHQHPPTAKRQRLIPWTSAMLVRMSIDPDSKAYKQVARLESATEMLHALEVFFSGPQKKRRFLKR